MHDALERGHRVTLVDGDRTVPLPDALARLRQCQLANQTTLKLGIGEVRESRLLMQLLLGCG